MVDGLFVTGGSGFVGRRLLKALPALGRPVYALQRTGGSGDAAIAGVQQVAGDLLNRPPMLPRCRSAARCCIWRPRQHAAADHLRTNAAGTARLLLAAARTPGSRVPLRQFHRRGISGYARVPLAIAKRTAEERAGVGYSLSDHPADDDPWSRRAILGSLEKLALLPVTVVPGSGRVGVQPVHVDDVVRCLMAAARDGLLRARPWPSAGRTSSRFAVLGEIRRTRKGATGGAVPRAAARAPNASAHGGTALSKGSADHRR